MYKTVNMIESYEFYDYRAPISENINEAGSEFTITAYNEEAITHPNGSLLVITGKLSVNKDNDILPPPLDLNKISFNNNGILNLFDRIDYYIGDCKIDSIRKPGVSTTMKGLVSFSQDLQYNLAGWKINSNESRNVLNSSGFFCISIPVKIIMGFFEDYKQCLYRIPQKLIFYRNTSGIKNSITLDNTYGNDITYKLNDIVWKLPQLKFSIEEETKLNKEILSNTDYPLLYRHWLYQSTNAAENATEFTWDLPVAYSRVKYILIGFQTDLENKINADNSKFNLNDLENVQVLLNNNIYYPRDRLNLKVSENKCYNLYYMFNNFKKSYYDAIIDEQPLVDFNKFINQYPIVAIDCSYQPVVIKESLINIKISFQWRTGVPRNTIIHSVMIMDQKAVYNPLNNRVLHS